MTRKWIWDEEHENLAEFSEYYAWQTFRDCRYNSLSPQREKWLAWGHQGKNPRCIYCGGETQKTSQRKNGNHFFYKCRQCGKGFTDLTGTPFHKTRLPMNKAMFLTALCLSDTPKKRIAELLRIARTAVIRHAERIKGSELCKKINEGLKERGITVERIREYLTPKTEEQEAVKHPGIIPGRWWPTRDDYRGRVFEI